MATRIIRRRKRTPGVCSFCKEGKEPDYKNKEALEKYLTDRARIIGGDRSGLCSKHQRKLSRAIKRARYLGFLPFTPSL
jgi:small subunit ribosomal protein S18